FGLERVIAHRQSGEDEGAGSVGDHGLREPGIDVAHGDFGIGNHSPGAVDYRSSKTGGSVLSLSGHGKRPNSQQDWQGSISYSDHILISFALKLSEQLPEQKFPQTSTTNIYAGIGRSFHGSSIRKRWSAATSFSVCDAPLGQRTAISRTCNTAPR